MNMNNNSSNDINVPINDVICPVYIKIVKKCLNFDIDELVLKGGRSSFKSTVMLVIVVLLVLITKRSAVVIVNHNNAVKKRLIAPLLKVMKMLQVKSAFHLNKTDMEFELIGYDGVKIQCIGCDDPDNIKSMSSEDNSAYCCIAFEELNNFRNKEFVDNIKATFLRGQGKQIVIYAFNPKRVSNDWCNKEYDKPCGKALGFNTNIYIENFDKKLDVDIKGKSQVINIKSKRVIFHTTIYDIIESGWINHLNPQTIAEAEKMKDKDINCWKWMYCGANTPAPGIRIFNNLAYWDGIKKDCFDMGLDEVYRGEDFGQGQHYTAYVEWMYDAVNQDIYITGEYGDIGLSYRKFVDEVHRLNPDNFDIYADYATITAWNTCEELGQSLTNCYKGEREPRYEYFKQNINHIYINPDITPHVYKELNEAEYELNAQGEPTSKPRKINDDFIDAFMYAGSDLVKANR